MNEKDSHISINIEAKKPIHKKRRKILRAYRIREDYEFLSDKALKIKFNHLKKHIYRDNRWQSSLFKDYYKKAEQPYREAVKNLTGFVIEYSTRIKSLPSLSKFIEDHLDIIINQLKEKKEEDRTIRYLISKSKIHLKDLNMLDDFLRCVKSLKPYLDCTDEELINKIHQIFYTNHSRLTLLKYYYKANSENM